jgi:hypothetical protein
MRNRPRRGILIEDRSGLGRGDRETARDNTGEMGVEAEIITARHRGVARPFENGEDADRVAGHQFARIGQHAHPPRRCPVRVWQTDGKPEAVAAIALDRFEPTGHPLRAAQGQTLGRAGRQRLAAMLRPAKAAGESEQAEHHEARRRAAPAGACRQPTSGGQDRQTGCPER